MYDRRQLSYQQRSCIHNAFDDIMEYTIVCDDPLEPKEIVAEIKEEVEQTFGTLHRKFGCKRARYFGLQKVLAQSHLKAMCLNLLKAANRLRVPVAA